MAKVVRKNNSNRVGKSNLYNSLATKECIECCRDIDYSALTALIAECCVVYEPESGEPEVYNYKFVPAEALEVCREANQAGIVQIRGRCWTVVYWDTGLTIQRLLEFGYIMDDDIWPDQLNVSCIRDGSVPEGQVDCEIDLCGGPCCAGCCYIEWKTNCFPREGDYETPAHTATYFDGVMPRTPEDDAPRGIEWSCCNYGGAGTEILQESWSETNTAWGFTCGQNRQVVYRVVLTGSHTTRSEMTRCDPISNNVNPSCVGSKNVNIDVEETQYFPEYDEEGNCTVRENRIFDNYNFSSNWPSADYNGCPCGNPHCAELEYQGHNGLINTRGGPCDLSDSGTISLDGYLFLDYETSTTCSGNCGSMTCNRRTYARVYSEEGNSSIRTYNHRYTWNFISSGPGEYCRENMCQKWREWYNAGGGPNSNPPYWCSSMQVDDYGNRVRLSRDRIQTLQKENLAKLNTTLQNTEVSAADIL